MQRQVDTIVLEVMIAIPLMDSASGFMAVTHHTFRITVTIHTMDTGPITAIDPIPVIMAGPIMEAPDTTEDGIIMVVDTGTTADRTVITGPTHTGLTSVTREFKSRIHPETAVHG